MPLNIYSVVLHLPLQYIEYVRRWKQGLAREIGWYHSVNSLAHITLLGFLAEEKWLTRSIEFLNAFSAGRAPLSLHFDHFGIYPGGTFFLAPDQSSKDALVPFMKSIATRFPLRCNRSTDPHVSIARGLDTPRLGKTTTFFSDTNPDVSCKIEGLSLRRLNPDRGQYDTIANFGFRSRVMPLADCTRQASLF